MSDEQGTSRNYCLDLIKGIACILIIFMHCEFPGKLGTAFQSVSRFCVPFFFMVSGYFCYNENKAINYSKKIKHIAIITLCASLFYLLITPLYNSNGIKISIKDIACWIVFNKPYYIAGQLWFLFALLYDYCMFAVFEKTNVQKKVYIGIPIAVILYIILAQGLHLLGKSVPNMIYRNFLIEGFAFFAMGLWMHEHQNRIKISNQWLILGFAVSTLLCPVERIILGRDFGVNIVSFVQAACIFIFCINNPETGRGRPLCRLGSHLSMFVYILHPAIWHLLDKLYGLIRISDSIVLRYTRPVICVIITVIVSILVVYLYQHVKPKKK